MSSPSDAVTVELDKAMEAGLMGYPPILNETIGVERLDARRERAPSSGTTGPTSQWGKCIMVGPLGFVVEWSEPVTIVAATGHEPLWRGSKTYRRFYPWEGVSIVWETASVPDAEFEGVDPDEEVLDQPSRAEAVRATQAGIAARERGRAADRAAAEARCLCEWDHTGDVSIPLPTRRCPVHAQLATVDAIFELR